MLGVLLKKEIMTHVYNKKYLAYFLTCFLLVVGSFVLLQQVYLDRLESYQDLRHTLRYNDHLSGCASFMKKGLPVVLPPNKLQVFYQGVEQDQVGYTQITLGNGLPFLKKETASYPVYNFFLSVDFAFIVVFILSLLVFAFSYDSVSGERERGTLKLVMANAVPRWLVLAAKTLAGYIGIALPFVLAFLTIMLITLLSVRFILLPADVAGVALIFGCATLYLFLMHVLGIFISVRSQRSATALSILMLIWIVFIIVFHNLALIIIEKVHHPPTMMGVEAKFYEDLGTIWSAFGKESQAKYGTEKWCLQPWQPPEKDKISPEQTGELLIRYSNEVKQATINNLDVYVNGLRTEGRLLNICSYFSPTLMFTQVISTLTNTGINGRIRQYGYFADCVKGLAAFMEQKIPSVAAAGAYCCQGWGHVTRKEEMPRFHYIPVPVKQRVGECMGYLGALAILTVLIFMAAYLAFMRMEVQ